MPRITRVPKDDVILSRSQKRGHAPLSASIFDFPKGTDPLGIGSVSYHETFVVLDRFVQNGLSSNITRKASGDGIQKRLDLAWFPFRLQLHLTRRQIPHKP